MTVKEQLDKFISSIQAFNEANCPSFLCPNSYFVSIVPGHNLDLLQVSFDFRVDRTFMLLSETPEELKDMSEPDLRVVRDE